MANFRPAGFEDDDDDDEFMFDDYDVKDEEMCVGTESYTANRNINAPGMAEPAISVNSTKPKVFVIRILLTRRFNVFQYHVCFLPFAVTKVIFIKS